MVKFVLELRISEGSISLRKIYVRVCPYTANVYLRRETRDVYITAGFPDLRRASR